MSQTKKIYPEKVKQKMGLDVILHCKSNGFTKWFYNKHTLPQNAVPTGENSATLQIINITVANDGKYYCYGSSDSNKPFFLTHHILTVIGEFYFE